MSLAQAISGGNVGKMTQLCSQDRRLLVLPFSLPNQAKETSALHLAAMSDHAPILAQILSLMDRRQAGLASAALVRSIEGEIPLQVALRASNSPAVIGGVLRAMGPGLPDVFERTSISNSRQEILDEVVTEVIVHRGSAGLDLVGQQISLCLSAGALPGGKDSQGCGLLHRAARANDGELIRWSLDNQGAEIGLRNHGGQTALHAAAEVGADYAMKALLDAGIEPGIEDNGGQTAVALARSRGQGTWAERLEKYLAAQAEGQQLLLEKKGLVGLTLLRLQQTISSQQEAMKEMTAKFSGLLLQLTETREALSQTQGRLNGAESKLIQTHKRAESFFQAFLPKLEQAERQNLFVRLMVNETVLAAPNRWHIPVPTWWRSAMPREPQRGKFVLDKFPLTAEVRHFSAELSRAAESKSPGPGR